MKSRCRVNKIGTEKLNFVNFCNYHATKKNPKQMGALWNWANKDLHVLDSAWQS